MSFRIKSQIAPAPAPQEEKTKTMGVISDLAILVNPKGPSDKVPSVVKTGAPVSAVQTGPTCGTNVGLAMRRSQGTDQDRL
jgi:hypothetical protein